MWLAVALVLAAVTAGPVVHYTEYINQQQMLDTHVVTPVLLFTNRVRIKSSFKLNLEDLVQKEINDPIVGF